MNIKELLGDAYKEGMTVEEITSALEKVSLSDDNSVELEKLKSALSKSNSEAAEYKKQLRAKQTEDEAAKQKEQEEREELQTKYEQLLHKTSVSENKAKLLSVGYDEKLADETAEAMANSDLDKVFVNQKKHLEAFEKKIRAEALKDTPKPTDDGNSETMTLEKLRGMAVQERLEYSTAHPEEYKELYGGKE